MEQQLRATSDSRGGQGVSELHAPFLTLQHPAFKADPYLRMFSILSRLEVREGGRRMGGREGLGGILSRQATGTGGSRIGVRCMPHWVDLCLTD